MPAYLFDSALLHYTVPGQQEIVRHCRTWVLAEGTTLSILTELPDDRGMSITNAAETVRAALEETWGRDCRIVEHYPWPGDAHYDEQWRDHGRTRWKRLDPADLRLELGPALDSTAPTRPAR